MMCGWRTASCLANSPLILADVRNIISLFKLLWISRIRVLHRILNKMRNQNNIDKHIYHSLYIIA